ncbi:Serine/arginine-rich splicing factor RS41 [Glycine max]|nr:Serine/arginine-rich splicing factor RS41 [Glycine max]KAH1241018.1 Serine/arginine-rich splicing factor RS41 [Glycine max]
MESRPVGLICYTQTQVGVVGFRNRRARKRSVVACKGISKLRKKKMKPVFCGNLDFDARQSDVERLFRRYGKVDRVDMKSGLDYLESWNVHALLGWMCFSAFLF